VRLLVLLLLLLLLLLVLLHRSSAAQMRARTLCASRCRGARRRRHA
jgi:hypothetical protein